MDNYTDNIGIIKKNEYLYGVLKSEDKNPVDIDYKDSQLRAKKDTTNCYINSKYDTDHEMNEMFKSKNLDARGVILFGIGNGKALDYIVELFDKLEVLIIIEPSNKLFNECLKTISIRSILSNKNIKFRFFVNENIDNVLDKIDNSIVSELAVDVEFVSHISYVSLFNDYYEEFNRKLIESINFRKINMTTNSLMGTTIWTYNTINNLLYKPYMIEDVSKSLIGYPVVLVMAGPSLNKNMHLIESAKKKALVCAVGSAINILAVNGIEPHLRFAFDGSPHENDIFESLEPSEIPLVYGNQLCSYIIDQYGKNVIHFSMDTNSIESYIYDKVELERSKYRSGFSIANTTLDIACAAFKSSKVILIGQDLSITEKRYAKGRVKDEILDAEARKRFIKTTDIYGNPVLTEKSYLGIRKNQEELVKVHESVEVINATEGGLNIEGTQNQRFEDVLKDLPDLDVTLTEVIKETLAVYEDNRIDSQKVMKELYLMKISLIEFKKQNAELLKKLKKVNRLRLNGVGVNRLAAELLEVENDFKGYNDVDVFTGAVFQLVSNKMNVLFLAYNKSLGEKKDNLENIERRYFGFVTEIDDAIKLVIDIINNRIKVKQ